MKIGRLEIQVRWVKKTKPPKPHNTLIQQGEPTKRKTTVNSDELDKWFAENYHCFDCGRDVRKYDELHGICTPKQQSLNKEK